MSHDHSHDESSYPIIWEVLNEEGGTRLTMLVQHTLEEARSQADTIYGPGTFIRDTGKRKPPNKCCNTCGPKPCGT